MSTIRERIMQALLARAQTFDAGAVRDYFIVAANELQQTSIADTFETRLSGDYHVERLQLTVLVGAAKRFVGSTPSVIANEMIGGLRAALDGGDITLGGLAEHLVYEASEINYPSPGGSSVGVTARFNVTYSTVRGSPDTLPEA